MGSTNTLYHCTWEFLRARSRCICLLSQALGWGKKSDTALGGHGWVHVAFLSVTHICGQTWWFLSEQEAGSCGGEVAADTGFGAGLCGACTR